MEKKTYRFFLRIERQDCKDLGFKWDVEFGLRVCKANYEDTWDRFCKNKIKKSFVIVLYHLFLQTFMQEQELLKHAENTDIDAKIIQKLDEHYGAVNCVSIFGKYLIATGSG